MALGEIAPAYDEPGTADAFDRPEPSAAAAPLPGGSFLLTFGDGAPWSLHTQLVLEVAPDPEGWRVDTCQVLEIWDIQTDEPPWLPIDQARLFLATDRPAEVFACRFEIDLVGRGADSVKGEFAVNPDEPDHVVTEALVETYERFIRAARR